jgi:hypothetical protein
MQCLTPILKEIGVLKVTQKPVPSQEKAVKTVNCKTLSSSRKVSKSPSKNAEGVASKVIIGSQTQRGVTNSNVP